MEIWRNVSPARNHWLLVNTIGTCSNRDGIGARLRVTTASGVQYNQVNTAVGYGCASDKRVHFGLATDALVKELRIEWPSGLVQTRRDFAADRILTLREGADAR
jgi:enediyne biosynthesis protein E4